MPKFTLICEHDGHSPSKNTLEFDAIFMDDVLEGFRQFLKGCTFEFSGNVEIVDYNYEIEKEDDEFIEKISDESIGHRVFDNMATSLMSVRGIPETIAVSETDTQTSAVCPVCKLSASVMQRNLCFDSKCGLK